jgi:signal peptidase I
VSNPDPSSLDLGDPPSESEPAPSAVASGVRSVVEWVVVVGGALIIALVIKTFLLQAFYIPSSSMETTLNIGDRVLVNKLSYRFHDVHRGDIIVFERPPGEADSEISDLIKRVIGLPGDVVEGQNGQVLINGEPLDEPYLDEGVTTGDFDPIEVPEDHLFMMGDNRGDSRDSRFFGPIAEDTIVGRAFFRVWPLGDISTL